MDLQAKVLLQKFGAGDHKPGSGSAAAHEGILSAQLLRTVIDLTYRRKHQRKYSQFIPKLNEILKDINNRILPRLEEIFQTDSEQFHKAIVRRKDRNNETDIQRKNELAQEALWELKPAILLPIEIAKLCIELAEFSEYVFDHGFKSARGDAGVAHTAAIAAIGGCLSIIYLNLLSFYETNDWTKKVRKEAAEIRQKHEELSLMAEKKIDAIKEEADKHDQCVSEVQSLLSCIPHESQLTNRIIEDITTQLQLLLWKHKDVVWKYDYIDDALDVLKPDAALKWMGYQYYESGALGNHEVNGELFNVAGVIDKNQKLVQVSLNLEKNIMNFTVAHELGHALFHNQTVLHRDRALDGSFSDTIRDSTEAQADKFAAYFLMPRKQVLSAFKKVFQMDRFIVNEDNVFLLTHKSLGAFRKEFPTKRDVARWLAESLADDFDVSIGAMAIRLEELNLITY